VSGKRLIIIIFAVAAAAVALVISLAIRTPDDAGSPEDDLAERFEKLRSVPYTSVTPDEVGRQRMGVTVYDRDRASAGYNLFCSGVSPEAYLMDMEGNVVHTWAYSTGRKRRWTWVHAILLAGGDLVVVDRFQNLIRLDWDSNPVWIHEMEVHHDVVELADGSLLTIDRETRPHRGFSVRFPAIVHLSAGGEELDRWSAYDHLDEIKGAFDRRSFLDTILDSLAAAGKAPVVETKVAGGVEVYEVDGEIIYDYFHMNTISLLPGNPLAEQDPAFTPGNLLICFRNVNQIAILDRRTKEVLWVWGEGMLEWPHHPTMLADGNVLVFDNGVVRKQSRILEVDPLTKRIEWEYTGRPPGSFYTYEKGSAQRLPNGNTLICEGDKGRAFEVTESGEIIWEWWNPNMQRLRRVQVYRMERIPADRVEHLLRPS
jgi:hypothetical protein